MIDIPINVNTYETIMPFCQHVVAKVTLVPCSVNLTGKRDKVGHGEVTIINARIITKLFAFSLYSLLLCHLISKRDKPLVLELLLHRIEAMYRNITFI